MSKSQNNVDRQPVVAILGHVDHGKSTLLDYIHKTNVVDGEAGGITQSISAYEVTINGRNMTFIDTPGHEAFQHMRERGVEIADIAILVVSAEDGVKTQTLEALKAITDTSIPYIVAINKIDKPGADIERTKMNLVENGIYLEGMGGDIPFVAISAKQGTEVDDLLENILLIHDMNPKPFNAKEEATGRVLESFVDQKRGISATLIIQDGTLPSSGAILAGTAYSPIRIVEDFKGKPVKNPHAGQAVKVTGFDEIPKAGSIFISSSDKKQLEKMQQEEKDKTQKVVLDPKIYRNARVVIPVILKVKTLGSIEAIKYELKKFETNDVKIKMLVESVGNITEGDIMLASGDEKTIILGFDVQMEAKARDQADRFGFKPQIFDIIYKLSEWFEAEVESRMPFEEVETMIGTLKVLKTFNTDKDKHVVGGRVEEGAMREGAIVKIVRRDFEVGRGRVTNLQMMKMKAKEVLEGNECGIEIETKNEIIPGDKIVAFNVEKKKIQ